MWTWYWRRIRSFGWYARDRASKATSAATHGGHWAPVNSSITATRLAAFSLRPSNFTGWNGGTAFSYSASSAPATFVSRASVAFASSALPAAVWVAFSTRRTRSWKAFGSPSFVASAPARAADSASASIPFSVRKISAFRTCVSRVDRGPYRAASSSIRLTHFSTSCGLALIFSAVRRSWVAASTA